MNVLKDFNMNIPMIHMMSHCHHLTKITLLKSQCKNQKRFENFWLLIQKEISIFHGSKAFTSTRKFSMACGKKKEDPVELFQL